MSVSSTESKCYAFSDSYQNFSFLFSCPPEILTKVFQHCTSREIVAASLTCVRLSNFFSNEKNIRPLFRRCFPSFSLDVTKDAWEQFQIAARALNNIEKGRYCV